MLERYRPTPEDFSRLKVKPDSFKVSGDGAFATFQGEGVTQGEPVIILRLHFCNLACGKTGGWNCDTGYTWDTTQSEFWKEPRDWTYSEAVDNIQTAWKKKFAGQTNPRLVITGGEPMLQQQKIVELIKRLSGWGVEIETNGTVMPVSELSFCQFNCSPKLENSGNSRARRYKPEVLKHLGKLSNSWFKFVAQDNSDLQEVDQISAECEMPQGRIFIMPEGHTQEEVARKANFLSGEISARGWRITMRNQLIWFGNKRGT